jgi:hypothetical protein
MNQIIRFFSCNKLNNFWAVSSEAFWFWPVTILPSTVKYVAKKSLSDNSLWFDFIQVANVWVLSILTSTPVQLDRGEYQGYDFVIHQGSE